jgi:hypothetical protein
MIVVEHTANCSEPSTVVAAALADLTGYPRWQPDVLEVSRADDGPIAVGARLTQTRKVMGRRTEVALTVTDYQPGESITVSTDPGARPAVTQSYRIHPNGETASRIDFRLELDGVPKLAEHLVKAQLSKTVPDMFTRLETLLGTP